MAHYNNKLKSFSTETLINELWERNLSNRYHCAAVPITDEWMRTAIENELGKCSDEQLSGMWAVFHNQGMQDHLEDVVWEELEAFVRDELGVV